MKTYEDIAFAISVAEVKADEAAIKVQDAKRELARWHDEIKKLKRELTLEFDAASKRAVNRDRAAAKRIANKYSITIEWATVVLPIDDSIRDYDGYDLKHWVGCPDWLEDDPLGDGHFSHSWSDTRWLVEFYAKHHPSHPKHSEREFLTASPHI